MKWITNIFKPKLVKMENKRPTLDQAYWEMMPALSLDDKIHYHTLSLGWIYEGIFDQDRFSRKMREQQVPLHHVRGVKQVLGKGWKRYNLGIL